MTNQFALQKHLSFEFFPPKTKSALTSLQHTASRLSVLKPDFFSITHGAGGTSKTKTLATALSLQANTTVTVVPHLSCMGATKEEIRHQLRRYQDNAITRIIVLRGDLPLQSQHKVGDFRFACDLLTFIREETGNYFHLDVAAYPEVHPETLNPTQDLEYFKQKISAGANAAITQYFFNADAYFRFVDNCHKLGIFVPIIPGIMPITNYEQLQRFSAFCGAEIPRWLRLRLESIADNPLAIKAYGCDVATDLCMKLLLGGAGGLHFYTLNKLEATLSICENLSLSGWHSKQQSFGVADRG